MSEVSEKILNLRSLGMTYNEISKSIPCSKGLISYYLGQDQRAKTVERTRKKRVSHPYVSKREKFLEQTKPSTPKLNLKWTKQMKNKIEDFCRTDSSHKATFTLEDIIARYGENPTCYLTGLPINIYEPKTYHFDHILPRSRGGDNSIENLGICTKRANLAKNDMTEDELIEFCKSVLKHKGII